jgi:hypothetical protein
VCVCVYINNVAIEKESLELLISMYIGMMMMMARVDIRSRQKREEEEKKSERRAFLYCSLLSGCKEAKQKKYGHGRKGAGWAPAVVSPLDSI